MPQKKENDRGIHNSYVRTIKHNEKFLSLLLAFRCWWQACRITELKYTVSSSHALKLFSEGIQANVTKWYSYIHGECFFGLMTVSKQQRYDHNICFIFYISVIITSTDEKSQERMRILNYHRHQHSKSLKLEQIIVQKFLK